MGVCKMDDFVNMSRIMCFEFFPFDKTNNYVVKDRLTRSI